MFFKKFIHRFWSFQLWEYFFDENLKILQKGEQSTYLLDIRNIIFVSNCVQITFWWIFKLFFVCVTKSESHFEINEQKCLLIRWEILISPKNVHQKRKILGNMSHFAGLYDAIFLSHKTKMCEFFAISPVYYIKCFAIRPCLLHKIENIFCYALSPHKTGKNYLKKGEVFKNNLE